MVWHRLADDEWELRLASESNMPQLQYSRVLSYPYLHIAKQLSDLFVESLSDTAERETRI